MPSRTHITWILLAFLIASRLVDVHAHVCSESDPDCIQETHAEAAEVVGADCADNCVDLTITIAEGVLSKLLDLSDVDLLAIISLVFLGWFFSQGNTLRPRPYRASPHQSEYYLTPPGRAPPQTL